MKGVATLPVLLAACHLALPLDGTGAGPPVAREAGGDDLQLVDGSVGCSALPGVLRCDDFEDPWAPGYELYAGDDAVMPRRVSPGHASNQALWTSAGPSFGWSIGHLDLSPPVTSGVVSVRAHVSLSLAPVPTWVSVFQVFDKDVDGNTKAGFDIGPGDEAHVHCPTDGWLATTGRPLKQATWFCVELLVNMDTKDVTLWIDGALVERCDPSTVTFPYEGFASVKFGAGTDQSSATVTLDDVVVARGPIGCP